MELWIRSQDKESLTKVSNVVLKEQTSPYMDRTKTYYLGTYYDNLQTLGTYKTKERALEVLDEIYKLIEQGDIVSRPNYLYGSYHMPGVGYNKLEISGHNIFGNKGSIVYEMPNE